MKIYNNLVVWFMLWVGSTFGAQLIISQPGQYSLGAPIVYTPSGSDAIIRITANDVLLDMNLNSIEQSGGSGSLNGIEIAAGVSNITIQNGIIKNLSGAGILINQNCNNVFIDNVQTLTVNQGIVLNSSANNQIKACKIANCFMNFTTNEALYIGPQTSDVIITNIIVDSCATTTFAVTFAGLSTNKSANNTISNVMITRCGSGIQLINTDNTLVQDCSVINNSNSSASCIGFLIMGVAGNQASGNILQGCAVLDLSAPGRSVQGFILDQTTKSNVTDCIVKMENSSSAIARGFYLVDSTNNVVLENCSVPRLTSTNRSLGFHVTNCQKIIIKNSEALSVQPTSVAVSTSDGFRIESSSVITIDDCVSSGNRNSGYTINTCDGVIVQKSISSGNTFNSFVSSANVRTVYDSCITNSTIGDGFAIADDSTLINNCKSIAVTNRGFGLDAASTNCIIQNSVALQCGGTTIGGFQNASGATRSVFNNNVATNCGIGFRELNATIASNRYFLNKATNNTTNYSGPIPSQNSAGSNATQGGNLSI